MAKDSHHRLISLPISINEMKRADGKTWAVLLISAVVAVVIVAAISIFVEKPKIVWPSSPKPAAAPTAAPAQSDEPRTYDVAPRGAVPPKSGTH